MCEGADRTSPFTNLVQIWTTQRCALPWSSLGIWPAAISKLNWNVLSHFLFRCSLLLKGWYVASAHALCKSSWSFPKTQERDEQSNRDKRKQLHFFTSVHLKYLQLISLFRANTGVNDRKFFKVNLFKAIEMKLTLFVVWGFSFLMLINVC